MPIEIELETAKLTVILPPYVDKNRGFTPKIFTCNKKNLNA